MPVCLRCGAETPAGDARAACPRCGLLLVETDETRPAGVPAVTADEREMLLEMPAVRELLREERAREREAVAVLIECHVAPPCTCEDCIGGARAPHQRPDHEGLAAAVRARQ